MLTQRTLGYERLEQQASEPLGYAVETLLDFFREVGQGFAENMGFHESTQGEVRDKEGHHALLGVPLKIVMEEMVAERVLPAHASDRAVGNYGLYLSNGALVEQVIAPILVQEPLAAQGCVEQGHETPAPGAPREGGLQGSWREPS